MTPFHCVISYFKKKNCFIEQKTFSPKIFSFEFFYDKLCKKWNLNAI